MSTATETIFNSMSSEETTQAALSALSPNPDTVVQLRTDLSGTSKVSIHRLFKWLFAYAAKLQQDLFDRFKVEVADLAKDGHFGTRRWFVAKALKFQYGDTLTFTDLDAFYSPVDPSHQIVTHAAVTESASHVTVKVAKANGSGLQKLSPSEALAVNDYFQLLRPPVIVTVLTADADKLRLYGAVIYDAQTPLVGVQAGVNAAITTYLNTLEFGGVMRVTDLKEAMLSADGVVDVRLDTIEAMTTGPWNSISRIYYSYAGYMVMDAGFPITSTLQWQAGNV